MKNINKIIFVCMMMTIKCMQASGDTSTENTPTTPIMGGSSATYAPILFSPTKKYTQESPNYVGNYFESSNTATIHNPNLTVENGYVFVNVIKFQPRDHNDMNLQDLHGKHLFGYIKYASNSSGNITSHTKKLDSLLFGELQE